MSQILKAVDELIKKAQGYTQHKGSGKEAEAVDHSIPTTEPKSDEKEKEKNEANSGTHPEAGGAAGKKGRAEGGADFKDGGPEEDTVETPKGSGGRAPVARADSIKHEGGGVGPNHPGTATTTQKQQKSEDDPDLTKSEEEVEKSEEEETLSKDEGEEEEKEEKGEDKEEGDDDDSEKSSDSSEIYIDIDKFAEEIVEKAVEKLEEKFGSFMEQAIQKSNESEYIEAGLAKSLTSTIDRLEEVEKAIVNIANAMNIRKSLIKSADNIKGIENPSLSRTELSKSEISSKLLDMQMQGTHGVDTNMVLRFDAVGDTSVLPESVRAKLGIE